MNNKLIFILLAIIALGSVIYIIYDEKRSKESQRHSHEGTGVHSHGGHSHGPHGEHD